MMSLDIAFLAERTSCSPTKLSTVDLGGSKRTLTEVGSVPGALGLGCRMT